MNIYLLVFMCDMYVWCTKKPEEASDPWELELQTVENYHVNAENWIQAFHKSSQDS